MAKARKIPHTFVIIGFVLLLCGFLTWIVPAGEFDHQTVTVEGVEKDVIVAGSYHQVESSPQSWQVLGAIVDGFKRQAAIIAFVLVIGGAFQILNSSRAIDYGIREFLKKVHRHWTIIVATMIIFSIFGAVFGMSEETIAFIVIFIPLSISMGYDSITGVLMVYVAAHIGFSGAVFNPFTIGIAQGLSGLPLFSGFEYRLVVWVILTLLIIAFTLWYANRVKKSMEFNSKTSLSAWIIFILSAAVIVVSAVLYPKTTVTLGGREVTFLCLPVLAALYVILGILTLRKSYLYFILSVLAFTIIFLVVGVLGYGWYVKEISALFLGMGIIAGVAMGSSANKIANEFIAGCKDILSAAIIVGLAGGIIEVLTAGKVMDTILYGLANTMSGTSRGGTVSIMYGIQTVLNLFIPSGTAKAALTMPIMAPFSDVIGLSRQATVMAYQFGDGFTNMITPTSAVLMGVLGVARIPYEVWLKWFWKILLVFMLIGLLLLMPTVYMNLNGF